MACVTLKRPLEWQDPSMSPEHGHGHMGSGGSPGGSPTSMIISNSPPHHSGGGGGGGVGAGGSCSSSYTSACFSPMGGVPNKRACLGSGIVHSTASSPFRATEQIRDEMLRLKMVRDRFVAANHSLQQQQQLQKSASSQTISISPVKRPSTSSSSVATSVSSHSSPSSSSSSSSSTVLPVETRNNTSAQQQQQPSATLLSVREIFLKAAAQSRTAGHHHHHHPNQPVFSLDEVVPIVERLLAEQEEHLRLLLQERLAEQYDQFRRFTADQLLVQAKARAMEQANQEGGGSSHVSYLS